MNGDMAFLLLVAVLLIPHLLIFAALYIEQKDNKTHDERALMLRGRAYRDAFYAMLVLCILFAILSGSRSILSMTPFMTLPAAMFFIVGCGISFLLSDFILRGVYLGRKDPEKIYRNNGFAMFIIIAIELLALLTWGDYSGFSIPFGFGAEAMMIMTLIWCMSLGVSSFARYYRFRKETEE